MPLTRVCGPHDDGGWKQIEKQLVAGKDKLEQAQSAK